MDGKPSYKKQRETVSVDGAEEKSGKLTMIAMWGAIIANPLRKRARNY